MSERYSYTLEILSTSVAKVDIDPQTATTEFVEGDIPVLQLVLRIGENPSPCTVYLEREQCVRLLSVINNAFSDPDGWLHTPPDEQEALRFEPPRLHPQEAAARLHCAVHSNRGSGSHWRHDAGLLPVRKGVRMAALP